MTFIIILILKVGLIFGTGYLGWSTVQDFSMLNAIDKLHTTQLEFEFNRLDFQEDFGKVNVTLPKYIVEGQTYTIEYIVEPGDDLDDTISFVLQTDPFISSISGVGIDFPTGEPYQIEEQFSIINGSIDSNRQKVSVRGVLSYSDEKIEAGDAYFIHVIQPAAVISANTWAIIKSIAFVILFFFTIWFIVRVQ